MFQLVNWLKEAKIPGYSQLYQKAPSVDVEGKFIFLGLTLINKNKKPERHEVMILRGDTTTGKIELVERLVDKLDFNGHVGGIAIKCIGGGQVHLNFNVDNDPDAGAMFPINAGIVDGNIVRDKATYKVK